MKFWKSAMYWRLAIAKCLLYMITVGVTSFLTQTETWSQETWDETKPFLFWRVFLIAGVAMIGVLIAFLDTSIQQIKNGNGKETTETEK
jgi:hypothetical protein